uniref:Uncharacterized protein n=1 Tax=Anguilla anguilla TaxID=7936 RepID=A0A0E9TPQ1_ANGAN
MFLVFIPTNFDHKRLIYYSEPEKNIQSLNAVTAGHLQHMVTCVN